MSDDSPRMTHRLATEHADHFERIPDYHEWAATVKTLADSVDTALPPEVRA